MVISESTLKWIMRFYPPLLLQRIWVIGFDPGFRGVRVRVKKSFLNRNYNNSIFGGAIFTAADPFYPVLLHQIFSAKGYKVIVWLKSSHIQYLKPARTRLEYKVMITDEEIAEMEIELVALGKFVKSCTTEMYDTNGILCASILCEVYLRDLNSIHQHKN